MSQQALDKYLAKIDAFDLSSVINVLNIVPGHQVSMMNGEQAEVVRVTTGYNSQTGMTEKNADGQVSNHFGTFEIKWELTTRRGGIMSGTLYWQATQAMLVRPAHSNPQVLVQKMPALCDCNDFVDVHNTVKCGRCNGMPRPDQMNFDIHRGPKIDEPVCICFGFSSRKCPTHGEAA